MHSNIWPGATQALVAVTLAKIILYAVAVCEKANSGNVDGSKSLSGQWSRALAS
jgi:hypothetical protein